MKLRNRGVDAYVFQKKRKIDEQRIKDTKNNRFVG